MSMDLMVKAMKTKVGKLYPKKASKKDARKAWDKLKPNADLQKAMLSALAQHCQSRDWLKEDGQFIPHCSSWINGEKWNDELKPAGAGKASNYAGLPTHTVDMYQEEANGPAF